ncbi:MAG: hypothetical protein ACKVZH_10530 [Blastocatellia bacterium]
MAVYGQTYKTYEGDLTPSWSRFLVIPRYAYQDLFKYTLFVVLYVICFVPPLIFATIVYFRHNAAALTMFNLNPAEVIPVNGWFFFAFTYVQTGFAFIFTVIIGPVLISRDLANNGLPLYLCRPFTRWEYILGKASVLLILLSTITWIPCSLVFLLHAYLEGGGWFTENFWMLYGILVVCVAWVVILTLLALAFSAWIKWRMAASAALFAIMIIPTPIGFAIQGILNSNKGHLLNISMAMTVMTQELFRLREDINVNDNDFFFSYGEAWMVFGAYAALCLYMLWRKVRAYEVIS